MSKKHIKTNSKVVKLIINVFKEYKLLTFLLFFIIIGTIGFSLATPQVLKYIIDDYLTVGGKSLLFPSLLYFATIVLLGIFNFGKEGIITIFGQKIIRKIKEEMMIKLEKIPIGYLSTNESGSVVSRFSNDVEAVGSLFTSGIVSMFVDAFKIIGIVISIWIFSYKLAILVLFIIPAVYFLTREFQKKMLKAQKLYRVLTAKVNNHIPESINNIQMIKSFAKEEYMENKYVDYLDKSYEAMDKINFYDSIFSPIILVLRAVVIAIVVILSSDYLSFLGISIGTVAAAIELINNIFTPIENLGMELQNIQQSIAGIYRIDEFLNEKEETKKKVDFTYEKIINSNLDIELKDVNFNYEEGENILENVNLSIKHKESVTFAGRTGSGKTTLFKLILGLLEPSSGSVTLSNVKVSEIPNYEKRKIFGYVEQSFSFIKGSVGEQISLKDEKISKKDIENAMKFVGLHDYIINLEEGYDTLASPHLFSQGQRQLLSIARAIVTSPPIMLLDEITANLDSETEEKIISVLRGVSSERTVLSISHRLTSVLTCDRIIKLENKNIVI
ncbi:MAG: ABC transporter ATP-binding protein [Terrisporobacter othiniensis]|uniref:ABC transporter ATP-binding protein/permease n=2 Tax=Terrisporobacter TaxID=1505652 RepID=A0AAX2ZEU2_9FIRM|nr:MULTISPECIES: ABC transporter ATP-binding protein [Terrisporobacter]MDU4861191.1 ABC transporter ATP-binding protein [Terrisporobacter othiniensis]MDU6994825.1 ABC transporter ATP-binding protein [Terrisporobacter othiniensis]UEL47829.1 ABC transporter ATP-binding protein/permease [Terrisporobacter hibernicus]SFJ22632.1 ATP-binding cassette, subfamily B [Terrisporobacter glycolicus]